MRAHILNFVQSSKKRGKRYPKTKTFSEIQPHLRRITYPFGNDNIGEFRINFIKFECLLNFDHLHVFDLGNLPIPDTIAINDHSLWEASVDFFIPKISRILIRNYLFIKHLQIFKILHLLFDLFQLDHTTHKEIDSFFFHNFNSYSKLGLKQ